MSAKQKLDLAVGRRCVAVLPWLQLAMVPTQRWSWQVRYHVSCDELQRTVSRSAWRSTDAESGTVTSAQPSTSTTRHNSYTMKDVIIHDGRLIKPHYAAWRITRVYVYIDRFHRVMLRIARTMSPQDVCPSVRLSVRPSVCLSVCHTPVLCQTLNVSNFFHRRVATLF